jgi:hypothetical protein
VSAKSDSAAPRRVLIVYYTLTQQTRLISETIAETLTAHGIAVDFLPIEFNDPRYPLSVPLRPFWRRLLGMIVPQVMQSSGSIAIDSARLTPPYDLICIGSPTWWLHPAMPITSFLRSDDAGRLLDGVPFAVFAVCRKFWWNNLRLVRSRAKKRGGKFTIGAGFCFQGGQVRSMLSFLNFLQTGENRSRFWGFEIYPFGVPAEGLERAREFANRLAEIVASGHREDG